LANGKASGWPSVLGAFRGMGEVPHGVGVGGRGLWWVAGQVYGGAMCGDVAIVVWAGNLVCKLECIGSLLGPLLLC
jgi:hypothetical protein